MLYAVVPRCRGAVTRRVLVDVFFPAESAAALGRPGRLHLTDVVKAYENGPAKDVREERSFALPFLMIGGGVGGGVGWGGG